MVALQSKKGDCEQAVRDAIDIGYRHIDTASLYGNEAEVGRAVGQKISEGVVKREDMFIVTKVSLNQSFSFISNVLLSLSLEITIIIRNKSVPQPLSLCKNLILDPSICTLCTPRWVLSQMTLTLSIHGVHSKSLSTRESFAHWVYLISIANNYLVCWNWPLYGQLPIRWSVHPIWLNRKCVRCVPNTTSSWLHTRLWQDLIVRLKVNRLP